MAEQFLQAVHALSSSDTNPNDRKAAEQWLLAFQKSDESWNVAKHVLSNGNYGQEVQTFAAQALKTKARMCRSASIDVCRHLQQDLVHLMRDNAQLAVQPLRQVVLALVSVTLPLVNDLPSLVQQLSQLLPLKQCLLFLETLADEASSLQPFGPGSLEDRIAATSNIKAALCGHAGSVFSWLAHVAGSHPMPAVSSAPAAEVVAASNAPDGQQDAASAELSEAILSCFNAWIRLGSLREIGMGDSQALVSLALAHLQSFTSPAFSTAGDLLGDVLDYCPDEWLDGLQAPMLRLADLAVAAARAGKAGHAETLCRVVASFGTLRINMDSPGSPPASAAVRDALLGLALLPEVDAEGAGDPVAYAPLQAWTALAESWMDMEVGGYDLFDGGDFYQEGGGAGRGAAAMAEEEEEGGDAPSGGRGKRGAAGAGSAANGQAPQIVTAAQLVEQQAQAHYAVPEEVCALYERLYQGLLHNLALWQRHVSATETLMDTFTPSFTAALGDCLAAVCSLIGPRRFTASLVSTLETQGEGQQAQAVDLVTAAMHAIAAAGGSRLTGEAHAMQMLVGIMQRTCGVEIKTHAALVAFCCAVSATGRAVVATMASKPDTAPSTSPFITSALSKALAGVQHEDDSLDIQTPAALAVKALMLGAQEAGVAVHLDCVKALITTLQKLQSRDTAAEQALVVALSSAVCTVPGGPDARRQVEFETLKQLAAPLHQELVSALHYSSKGSSWDNISDACGGQVTHHLRRYALLMQHALTQAGGSDRQQQVAAQQRVSGQVTQEPDSGFSWLASTFLRELWPQLGPLVQNHDTCADFLQPLSRCLVILFKVQPQGTREAMQGVVEAMVSALFRPGGKHAAEALCAALEGLGSDPQATGLLHQALTHVFNEGRMAPLAELGHADQAPDLAEAFLKAATGYVRYLLAVVAAQNIDAACGALSTVCKVSAACCCANHRGVSSLALTCVSAVVAAARTAASTQSLTQLVSTVIHHAGLITAGFVGGLLSSSPMSRVQRVGAVLVELAGLAVAASQQPQAAPDMQQASAMIGEWLSNATQHFQASVGAEEKGSIVSTWPGALLEAVAAEKLSSREQQVASRRLKKMVREFAELHSRTQ